MDMIEGIPASKAFTGEYAEKTFLAVKKYLELIEKSLRDAGALKQFVLLNLVIDTYFVDSCTWISVRAIDLYT